MTVTFEADQAKQEPLLSVSVYEGKYTVIQAYNGALSALRYGEPWRDCCGDGLILALAGDLDETRAKLAAREQRIAELEDEARHIIGLAKNGERLVYFQIAADRLKKLLEKKVIA